MATKNITPDRVIWDEITSIGNEELIHRMQIIHSNEALETLNTEKRAAYAKLSTVKEAKAAQSK